MHKHTIRIPQEQLLFSRQYLISLILPLIAEQVLAITIGLADTMMVSQSGEAAVSGVSLVDSLSNLFIQLFGAFATGGAVISSQYLGQKNQIHASLAAKQLIYVSLFSAVALIAFGIPFRPIILRTIFGDIEGQVMRPAVHYFLFVLLSFPGLAIFNSCAALFRSMGNSKATMKVSLLMNVIHITGNAWLIFGMGLGVMGAGISTFVARSTAAIIMLVMIHKKRHPIHVDNIFAFEWRPILIKKILRIAVPSGIENSMFQIGKLSVQSLTASFGTVALAANAISSALAGFSNIPGNAIGLASITVIGQCVGAGEYRQVSYYSKRFIILVYASVFALCVPMLFLAHPLIQLFHVSEAASTLAEQVLMLNLLVSLVFWPPSFTVGNFLRATGDARFTMTISMLSMWVFRVGLSYLFASFGWGLQGVWIAMYVDWLVRGIAFSSRLINGGWKNKQVV
ncbi:MATE family efflux transporter [Parasphaerochaeta coccoides]|uniref:Multidrug-efflux transporter n=1 Tax=Parasphaerochaeta coccoides (strain ATCC BAA-1237 / DSM 17374 / SPN1) TaxID=760011 RepID=F4GJF4_PARC1|nr:MATE family efflux transporter [Parasphaerochaeta coccoides]AEC02219.1 MATE efflux family protein [Parasphaerochaeta coccoides DSM 17374]